MTTFYVNLSRRDLAVALQAIGILKKDEIVINIDPPDWKKSLRLTIDNIDKEDSNAKS